MKIYDCITFFNSNFLFETRLNILNKYVDFFVVCSKEFFLTILLGSFFLIENDTDVTAFCDMITYEVDITLLSSNQASDY